MPSLQPSRPHLALALGLLALTALLAWQTTEIAESTYADVGPRVVPWIVLSGFGALAFGLLWRALRGGWDAGGDPDAGPVNRRAIGWFLLGLALNVGFLSRWSGSIPPAGFVFASTALFTCVARAFGSERPSRDFLIGVAVALAAYLGFDRGLGVNLGAGWLSGIL